MIRSKSELINTLEKLIDLSLLGLSNFPQAKDSHIAAVVSSVCIACEMVPYESYVVKVVTRELRNLEALSDGT